MLNGKQSVTLCLAFRLCKQCLNGVKRSKQFCTTPQKMHIHALKNKYSSKYTYLCTEKTSIYIYVCNKTSIHIYPWKEIKYTPLCM